MTPANAMRALKQVMQLISYDASMQMIVILVEKSINHEAATLIMTECLPFSHFDAPSVQSFVDACERATPLDSNSL